MDTFLPIYLEKSIKVLRKNAIQTKLNANEENEVIELFLTSKFVFVSYEKFTDYCSNYEREKIE